MPARMPRNDVSERRWYNIGHITNATSSSGVDKMDLTDPVETINSREDLVEFIEALRHDLTESREDWENPTLDSFLEAMAAWVHAMNGYYKNLQLPVPNSPSWKTVGEMLIAAKTYE
jgi:hypothetical protein